MREFALIAAVAVAACTTPPPPPPPLVGGTCNADGLGHFVGQPATSEVAAAILRESGARTFRWTGPGIMVTMDLRGDRVNANLNEGLSRIESVSCG